MELPIFMFITKNFLAQIKITRWMKYQAWRGTELKAPPHYFRPETCSIVRFFRVYGAELLDAVAKHLQSPAISC